MIASSTSPASLAAGSSTRRTSSPKLSLAIEAARANNTSPSSSEDDPIPELSFEYTKTEDGRYVRVRRVDNAHSSPPTPHDSEQDSEPEDDYAPSRPQKLPSPKLSHTPATRTALSRSEHLYAGERPNSNSSPRVPIQSRRMLSNLGASTPAASSAAAPPRYPMSVDAALHRPQRVTLEEFREKEERVRKQVEELKIKLEEEQRRGTAAEESENAMTDEEFGVVGAAGQRQLGSSKSRAASFQNGSSRATRGASSSTNVPSLADVSAPHRERERPQLREIAPGPNRAGRVVRSSVNRYPSSSAWSPIEEVHSRDGDQPEGSDAYDRRWDRGGEEQSADDDPYAQVAALDGGTARQKPYAGASSLLAKPGSTRPRRSASLSDAAAALEERAQPGNANPSAYMNNHYQARPGTSIGYRTAAKETRAPSPPRRSWEGKVKAQRENALQDDRYAREEHEGRGYGNASSHPYERARQSPSPTHIAPQRPSAYAHSKGNSDPLRAQLPESPGESPPPADPLPARLSPSARNFANGLSAASAAALNGSRPNHRRSPTAPSQVASGSGALASSSSLAKANSWEEERDGSDGAGNYGAPPVRSVSRSARSAQQQHQVPVQHRPPPNPPQQQHAPVQPQQQQHNTRNQIIVNNRIYIRLDLIGKGGSSRVYRVMNSANEVFAIKRVSLEKTDDDAIVGYKNEISILKRLAGNQRIIRLHESELQQGLKGDKGHLLLVMELGEIDLAKLLYEQQKEPMNMVWISYYWQQMLQAVHVIHEEKIVHSDLKPANFVLVRGQLKLIDFGIANAIANDTTNIQRDHQVGTVNYMSPEAIELPDGMRRLKLGRPSDVWSLGCILYEMVYGHAPFYHLSVYQKMKAIPDVTHTIPFPDFSTRTPRQSQSSPQEGSAPVPATESTRRSVRTDVIQGMKSCLCRNPKERLTIPELLEQDWLTFKESEPPTPPPPPPPPPSPPPLPASAQIKQLLEKDQTIINTYYMEQLLKHGIQMGKDKKVMSDADLTAYASSLVGQLRGMPIS